MNVVTETQRKRFIARVDNAMRRFGRYHSASTLTPRQSAQRHYGSRHRQR